MKNACTALEAMGIDVRTINKFLQWHKENPSVWQDFENMAMRLIKKGIARYGAKAIMEALRYERTYAYGGEFKINNNYSAYFARIFQLKHPQYKSFFETRTIKGLTK